MSDGNMERQVHLVAAPSSTGSTFHFFLLSEESVIEQNRVSIHGVLSSFKLPASEFAWEIAVHATVGAWLNPRTAAGKQLELVLWRRTGDGDQSALFRTELPVPDSSGPVVMNYQIPLKAGYPGLFGADLIDRDGIFGPPDGHLATYQFEIGRE